MFIFLRHNNGNRGYREDDVAIRLASIPVGSVASIMTEFDTEIARLDADIAVNNDDQLLNDDRSRIAHAKLHLQVAIDRNLETQKQATIDALHNGEDI